VPIERDRPSFAAVGLAIGTLRGVRELGALRRDELLSMGEEAADLARVADLGVPFGAIWLIGLTDNAESQVLAAVTAAMALDLEDPIIELGGFHASHAVAVRSRRFWPRPIALRRGDDVRGRVRELFGVLESPGLLVALGGARTEIAIRVTVRDRGPSGIAASVDPSTGDPEAIAVWSAGNAPWVLDRKTMRLVNEGGGALPSDVVERAADLADRAQLALGKPIELEFGQLRGRLVVLAVRPIALTPGFTDAPMRRVALLSADEGPIAPLAVDALDRALRTVANEPASDTPWVERHYARAYRRIALDALDGAGAGASITRAASRAAQVASDLVRPLVAWRRFEDGLDRRLAAFDREVLGEIDGHAMLATLRDRMRVVSEVIVLLQSARVATLAGFSALEAACGILPRECIRSLSAIRKTRARRKAEERMLGLARHLIEQLGEIPEPRRIPHGLRRRWDETRAELGELRVLGVDVRPVPFASDDRVLRAALLEQLRAPELDEETARREAIRRLLATARVRPLGTAREAIAASISLGFGPLADAKGRMGEALASAMLRLRAGACAAGARMVEGGILDEPEDALYLDLAEIEEALTGEPGAYAARVRLRREADARWRNCDPPRRLAARVTESR
jgi:hypothetical protein